MSSIADILWLIPVLPGCAALVGMLLGAHHRRLAMTISLGAMVLACGLSFWAMAATVGTVPVEGQSAREIRLFEWMPLGTGSLVLGWVLDPLSASMLAMVTFVGSLIFIFSVGYMEHDKNAKQFFCFLSLFAAAMLGLIISNSLLLLFICWELVGLASYLLIGFWFHKPEAAAAAKKAFLTTRIGDLGFLIGMLWLYTRTGTLLFYDHGEGCLETGGLAQLIGTTVIGGVATSTMIALLLFCGAAGKSGQVPLHVWLPDAMEGPTPVSALIHAATMVAAGVFLVARLMPLFAADSSAEHLSAAISVVVWMGAITALYGALVAIAQNDIKRILAYSTVSQLGYMMMGLGLGGVAVGMFHLVAHAFFKALLFLGAGSVIHGCHEEQDIRKMGGLRHAMPWTFLTYAVGMLALAGVFPLIGFWSKDEILLSAYVSGHGATSLVPFLMGLCGAGLTAFYMTRQVVVVFFGAYRGDAARDRVPHESPRVMTVPLAILALCTVGFGLAGPWAWNWFSHFVDPNAHHEVSTAVKWTIAIISLGVATVGILLGGLAYRGWLSDSAAGELDPVARRLPVAYKALANRLYFDELYDLTLIRWTNFLCAVSQWLESQVWGKTSFLGNLVISRLGRFSAAVDERAVNRGFDRGCESLRLGSRFLRRLQDGRIQTYLRVMVASAAILLLMLAWGGKG